ncbi:MAG: efflux RND transporter permease subunit [Tepidisphaerales bacterium]
MSRVFIDRPVLATVLAVLILLAGAVSIMTLPVAQYPEITPPTVQVTVVYPGANANTVAQSVGVPIEQEISGVDNLLYFDSRSTNDGTYTLTCTFEVGTDIDQAMVQVQNRVNRAAPRLPAEATRRGILVDKSNPNILCVITLRSDNPLYDAIYLSNYATINVRDALRRLPGVGDAVVFGNREYAMRVWVNPDTMATRNITVTDVATAIREQNALFSAGRVGAAPAPPGTEMTLPVLTRGRLSEPTQFERIIVRSNPDGSQVLLSDIAEVELGSESYDLQARVDGKDSAGILVYLRTGGNALDTMRGIRSTLDELRPMLPAGVEMFIPFDTTRFVEVSIGEVVKTLFEAAILVALVVLVFLQNWRPTVIPLVAVPVSIVGAFAGMFLLGYTINTLTLFGLVLAIGIVVDDAIIVVENVERILEGEPGLSVRDATIKAMEQVSGPIIAITLVLAAVFIPVAFAGGITGQFYQQFAITITVSVAISGVIALTLTPALCRLMLRHRTPAQRGPFGWFNRGFTLLTTAYVWTVRHAIRYGVVTVLLFAGVCYAAYALFSRVPTAFLQVEDQGYLVTAVQLPQGASVDRTGNVVQKVENWWLAQPETRNVVSLTGFDYVSGGIPTTNGAVLFMPLKDWDERQAPQSSAEALVGRSFEGLAGINEALVFTVAPPPIQGLGVRAGFDVRIIAAPGADLNQLHAVCLKFIEALGRRPEIAPGSTFTPLSVALPQVSVNVDTTRAKSLGVPVSDLYDAMQAMFGSLYVNDFEKLGRIWRVQLQAQPQFRATPQDFERIHVRNASGEMVPLSALVDFGFAVGPNAVFRFNARTAAQISGAVAPGYASGQMLRAVREVAAEVLPPGFSYEWAGESFQEIKAGNTASLLMMMGLVVVFLLLAALYENWVLPLAVLLAVPFGALGAYAAVLLRGFPADIYFQVGLLTLIALIAKNAILIVEFCVLKRKAGESLLDSATHAARERLRPVLMTSFAFILGVVPLALASGAGAVARKSIGTGIMGGMIVASTLALLFVPLFFVILQWTSEKLGLQSKQGEQPAADTHPAPPQPTA